MTSFDLLQKRLTIPTLTALALVLVGLTLYCFLRPSVDLDSFAYYALLDSDHHGAFAEAPEVCATQIPGPNVLCNQNPFYSRAAKLSNDPFEQFLSFYRVKPLYIYSALLLHHQLHLRSFVILRVISSASFAIIAIVIAMWLGRYFPPVTACTLSLLMCATAPVLALGKSLLPDAFSDALLLLVLYTIVYLSSNLWVQLALLALLPLARIDNIIFCLIFGGMLIYRATPQPTRRYMRLAALVFACVFYNLLLQHLAHAPSYITLYNYTFLGWTLDSPAPRLLPGTYLRNEVNRFTCSVAESSLGVTFYRPGINEAATTTSS